MKKVPTEQTIKVVGPSKAAVTRMVEHVCQCIQDLHDSGDGPAQVFYELGKPRPSDAEFE